ncbi:hypothetical protein F477_01349 [Pseudomonas sp. URIL14HWK12:I3]|uniref:hypothetical protein n=1 Tax=unclassified Pseudomonas TaxID=196821 RepID=UPI000DAB4399|nr:MULTISPECIES: hypothetical protein [unclassified Pseudomonas]PZW54564.1 hypothetical protein F478_02003 [Pseudomonas sp. URIL14HWK12:I2]PZW59907.1 hypothetical protein F477_01349 [Pseudomonas sp. URIL14HWK12:I3]
MEITLQGLERMIDGAIEGNIIQASRRIIFTYCNEEAKTRGFFFADILYNLGGTGLLVKYEEKFFLLTAQHVINVHYTEPQNESPFFTNALARSQWDDLNKLLYPIRGWKIGSLIESDISWIDDEDIVLIEMGHPMPGGYPEHFLDFDNIESVSHVRKEDFRNGLILLAAGYPIDENHVMPAVGGEHDFVTNLSRRTYPGFCVVEEGNPYIRFERQYTHEEMNGMSGGVVTNVEPVAKDTRWVGMIQKAGNGTLRFYPAYLILPALLRYREAPNYIIDPAANLVKLECQSSPEAIQGRKKYNEILKKMGNHQRLK